MSNLRTRCSLALLALTCGAVWAGTPYQRPVAGPQGCAAPQSLVTPMTQPPLTASVADEEQLASRPIDRQLLVGGTVREGLDAREVDGLPTCPALAACVGLRLCPGGGAAVCGPVGPCSSTNTGNTQCQFSGTGAVFTCTSGTIWLQTCNCGSDCGACDGKEKRLICQ